MSYFDTEKSLKLKEAYHGPMSNAAFAAYCAEHKITVQNWGMQLDGHVSFLIDETWQSFKIDSPEAKEAAHTHNILASYDSYMHLLAEAVQKGQTGILRIPQKYRDQFTITDVMERIFYYDSWAQSPAEIMTGNFNATLHWMRFFPGIKAHVESELKTETASLKRVDALMPVQLENALTDVFAYNTAIQQIGHRIAARRLDLTRLDEFAQKARKGRIALAC